MLSLTLYGAQQNGYNLYCKHRLKEAGSDLKRTQNADGGISHPVFKQIANEWNQLNDAEKQVTYSFIQQCIYSRFAVLLYILLFNSQTHTHLCDLLQQSWKRTAKASASDTTAFTHINKLKSLPTKDLIDALDELLGKLEFLSALLFTELELQSSNTSSIFHKIDKALRNVAARIHASSGIYHIQLFIILSSIYLVSIH